VNGLRQESSGVAVDGKHLTLGGAPHRVKGVTYGGFTTRPDGYRFPTPDRIAADFALIAAAGMNTVRLYDLPPTEVLDFAAQHHLRLIVGLGPDHWRMERGADRTARRHIRLSGRSALHEAMLRCAGRREVMAIAVGNEIPVDLVRLHGARHVAAVLTDLIEEVHALDPGMLATYVNFPTTEFLDPEGQDLVCFNVFLEDESSFRRYVRHLQVVSAERPLVLTELGLAADIHGEAAQRDLLETQLRVIDEEGVAGATVYGWTDDWAVDDQPVTGWGFGITDANRRPKAALGAVEDWCVRRTVDLREDWPLVTAIVCAYNEERTLGACLDSLEACMYPNLEVVVCDDGSTDRTLEVAGRYPFKLLELPHGGLSRARNAGLEAANGEIVAYLDADAACHPEWPYHLVLSMAAGVAGAGGPNLPWPSAGFVERAVARSPGAPSEVLLSDDRAEHVPGCNMAFDAEELRAIGGFDVAYTAAGDDVDVCWKLLDRGRQIAFSPAAQVYHRRRGTVTGYLRQQRGYGRAERMLVGPHRARFNRLGQASWKGFIYGGSRVLPSLLRPIVYHGWQGQAPFQPVIENRASSAATWAGSLLPLVVLVAIGGLVLSPWSTSWLLATLMGLVAVAGYGVAVAVGLSVDRSEAKPARLRGFVGLLHVLQPFARLWGRLRARPLPRVESPHPWRGDRSDWLTRLARQLRASGLSVDEGGPSEPWDLRVAAGPFVTIRLAVAVVWSWEPRWRARYALEAPAYAVLAVSPVMALLGSWYGMAAGAIVIALALGASVRARSKVVSAIEATTSGAILDEKPAS
jgi:glycosyltransferase involved in cell wall biosynthesis